MKLKGALRRTRLKLAPENSRFDCLYRRVNELISHFRHTTPSRVILRLMPGFIADRVRKSLRKRRAAQLISYQNQIKEIVRQNSDADQVIVFPPGLDWNVQLFQRPQQLALAFARQGALVFYIQPDVSYKTISVTPIRERLYLCNIPVEAFDFMDQPILYLLTWNRDYARSFNEPRLLYDYVDDIDAFYGDHFQMRRDHQKLLRQSLLVLATAERLYQEVKSIRPDALLSPNGADAEHFANPEKFGDVPPDDIATVLTTGRPIIGYYGALARWFDYELLYQLASLRTDLSFVLIGPDYDSSLPPRLLDLSNVSWLGVKHYPEIPNYVRFFEVGIIPFQLNNITHATSPLKLFEYMAAGKPVVITPMQESMRYPGVLVAGDVDEFSSQIDRAVLLKDDPEYLHVLACAVKENTWDTRALQILNRLKTEVNQPNKIKNYS